MYFFNRRSVWLAALLLGGCASLSAQSQVGGPPGPYASSRWVALKADGDIDKPCPLLLNQFPLENTLPAASRFCVYEQRDGRPPEELEGLLKNKEIFQDFTRDYAVVGPLGSGPLLMQSWEPLRKHFDTQVGRNWVSYAGDRQIDVRLAILDTQPKDLWTGKNKKAGNSPHGWSLAHMARHLVCPDGDSTMSGPCFADVTTQLALPWRKLNRSRADRPYLDNKDGGYYGTLYDLEKAIERELNDVEPDHHLVLNLSVGWDQEALEKLTNTEETEPVALLKQVLTKAACQGVLVIAAAGNRVGGPTEETGLLRPAAWVGQKVQEGDCEPYGVSEASGLPRPLVYAVGGVDRDSNPLSNAREEGMPELVAFADHAVVETFDPKEPTKTYTGSSVAAVVASAAAAAVWSQRPKLTAREVIETLYNSGSELALTANVVAAPPLGSTARTQLAALNPPESLEPAFLSTCLYPHCVHRICLRRALCKAQGVNFLTCSQETCSESEPLHLSLDFDLVADAVTRVQQTQPPSPSKQLESALAHPWVGPQPQDPPCPNCTLEPPPTGESGTGDTSTSFTASANTYTLHIEIDDDWPSDMLLYDATLVFGDFDQYLISLPAPPGFLHTGDHLKVEVSAEPVQNALGASMPIVLEFRVCESRPPCNDPRSVENPVLVVQ